MNDTNKSIFNAILEFIQSFFNGKKPKSTTIFIILNNDNGYKKNQILNIEEFCSIIFVEAKGFVIKEQLITKDKNIQKEQSLKLYSYLEISTEFKNKDFQALAQIKSKNELENYLKKHCQNNTFKIENVLPFDSQKFDHEDIHNNY